MRAERGIRRSATHALTLVMAGLAAGATGARAQGAGYPVLPGSGYPFPSPQPPTAAPGTADGGAPEATPGLSPAAPVPDPAHRIEPQTAPEFAPGWTVAPQISISGAFNDNILQTPHDRKADFVTYIAPQIELRGDTPRLQASVDYAPTAGLYTSNSGQDFVAQNLTAYALGTLVEDSVFLDARGFAGVSPTSGGFPVGASGFGTPGLGGFGPGTSTTTLLSGSNQTQSYSFAATPYFVHRFADAGTLTVANRTSVSVFSGGFGASGYSYPQVGNGNAVPVAGSQPNSNLFANEELVQFVSGPALGRIRNTALLDASQFAGNGVVSGAHQLFVTDRLGYALNRHVLVFGEVGYESVGYPKAYPKVAIDDAVWAIGTTLTPDPNSTVTIGYGHRYGFDAAFLDGTYAVTARTTVFARYQTGLGTDLETLQGLVALSGSGPNGDIVDSTTGAPLFLGNPGLGVQGNATLNRTRTFSAGAVTRLDRDTISAAVVGSDQTAVASSGGASAGDSRAISGDITWQHQISDAAQTSLYVGGGEQQQSFLVPDGSNARETFFGTLASYTYAFTPTLTGIAQYGYFQRSSPIALRRFNQNVVLVGVTKQF